MAGYLGGPVLEISHSMIRAQRLERYKILTEGVSKASPISNSYQERFEIIFDTARLS